MSSGSFKNFIYKMCLEITYLIYMYIRGAYDKFPDFFRMGTFIDSTHMIL